MSKTDEKFIKLAIKEAKKVKGPKKFGAVIVKNGRIIAKAHNTSYQENDPTKHAEIIAVSKAAKTLGNRHINGCIIYSTCEPCMMCLGAILFARINEVIYGMSREDALEHFGDSNPWHKNIEEISPAGLKILKGILREECKQAFRGPE